MVDLYAFSKELILTTQDRSGAYIASPNFPTYRYAWFRDGAFIAYAMDLIGEHASAARFHDWAARTIARHATEAQACIVKAKRGQSISPNDGLHARYTLDGKEGTEAWPNLQFDGYGTWLWSVVEHLRCTHDVAAAARWAAALELVADYLAALWRYPNYDCWEESGNRVHVSTLAALYGGLRAYADWRGDSARARVAEDIRAFVMEQGVRDGHLVKFIGSDAVDASLLSAATPYRLLPVDDPRMMATVEKIECDLVRDGGGIHRYAADSYFGGGEWILLTAWLGWYYAERGETARARECLDWVAAQADARGELPEQIPAHLNVSREYSTWVARWGAIAKPLLWSHAKFLILEKALRIE